MTRNAQSELLIRSLLQAIPERYSKYKLAAVDEFFAMGRGLQKPGQEGEPAIDVPSLVCEARPSLYRLFQTYHSLRKWSNGSTPTIIT